MKSGPPLQLNNLSHRQRSGVAAAGFTVFELLIVILVGALLATVALAATHASSRQVLQAQCAENQRQIGAALNVYAAEHNEFLPVCKFRNQNTWYTYEAARTSGGGGTLFQGFMNLGLLFRTKAISTAKPLYCPAQTNEPWTYEYYMQGTNGWPSGPAIDDNVRTGYSYFPQLRETEYVGLGIILPKITATSVDLEYGSLIDSALVPAKISDVDLERSIATDLIGSSSLMPHQAYGEATGINALFPDGSVVFQNARQRSELFDGLDNSIGNNGLGWRRVMTFWEQ